MTATVERYVEYNKEWIPHNELHEGMRVKGVLPNSEGMFEFEATTLPAGQGFTTVIDGKTQTVTPGQPAVEYWRKDYMRKKQFTKFRLIPT
jgi:hypothetical protein